MPVDPLTQPGVHLVFDGGQAFMTAIRTPGGAMFQIGFKDERSGMTAHVGMDQLMLAEYMRDLATLRGAATTRGGDDGEVAGQTGGA